MTILRLYLRVYLLTVYAKSKKEDLSPHERSAFRKGRKAARR